MVASQTASNPARAQAGETSGAEGKLARSQRWVLLASAAVATVAAWLWLARMGQPHATLLGPHQHHHGHTGSFLDAVLMWQAMTVAMMTPTVFRWLLTFAKFNAGAGQGRAVLSPVGAFAAGYFVIWIGYSIVGAALQMGLQQVGGLDMQGRVAGSAAGLVLIAAGLLQFAPFKDACLKHCRNPLTYFLTRWRNGPVGGFRLGLSHGAYCIGCCWALMLTGFAMGVMNLAWMAVLTVVLCLEQAVRRGDRIVMGFGVVVVVWGSVLLFYAL